MSEQTISTKKTAPEQIIYADMLFYGCWFSLGLMVVTYLIYTLGFVSPHIPLEQIPMLWSKPVKEYLASGAPSGWGWAKLLGKGDFLNFAGIALQAGMTVICFVPLIPAFLKKKDKIMATIALLEILVLIFAASGIVGGGAH